MDTLTRTMDICPLNWTQQLLNARIIPHLLNLSILNQKYSVMHLLLLLTRTCPSTLDKTIVSESIKAMVHAFQQIQNEDKFELLRCIIQWLNFMGPLNPQECEWSIPLRNTVKLIFKAKLCK
jgi:hypothetical protein